MENSLSPLPGADLPYLNLSTAAKPGIIVFSHLRWNFVWQRPQQFLSRFASDHRILFIEEPIYGAADPDSGCVELESVAPQIVVAKMHLNESLRGDPAEAQIRSRLAKQAVAACNDAGDFSGPLLWYYTPMDLSWSVDLFQHSGIIYDCMDELSKFRGAPPEMVAAEKELLAKADIVFTGGYELWMQKAKQHPNVHFFGCGVEVEHFGKARSPMTAVPADIASLPGPILGWFGVIDERVDYDLLRGIAELRPGWSIAMVGPVVKVDPAELPQARNIHWLGGRDYKELPSYCKGFDVCMMPFALNDSTEYINPTKALEYFATGKPVISTPVRDVVRQYSGLAYIESDAESFVERIEEILANPDEDRLESAFVKAAASSWENTVARMQMLIAESIELDHPTAARVSLK